MKVFLFVFFHLLFVPEVFAQGGCTDTQANNYDPLAIENDGSCLYPSTTYQIEEIAILPDQIEEISGMVYFENQLWANLDAGNPNELYQIDTLTGEVLKKVIISNADNLDWEDLAQDDTHIYIGDFGNNIGNRTDLKIYKIPKFQLNQTVAFPEIISFTLNDQSDFSLGNNDHNYDLEAFFVGSDSIHLFSKNWQDFKTRHYTIANQIGEQTAFLRDSLDVQGQITGADMTKNGEIVLLGYNTATSQVFLWLLFDYPADQIFKGNKRKISLGTALNTSQTEAMAFRTEGYGYIGAESFSFLPPKLHRFSIDQWLNPIMNNTTDKVDEIKLKIFPNPAKENITIQIEPLNTPFTISIINNTGAIKYQSEMRAGQTQFKLKNLNLTAGNYVLQLQSKEKLISKVFVIH